MTMRTFSILIATFVCTASMPGAARPADPDEAPWKRLLSGEDAKRVAALDEKMTQLYDAGRYEEAREPARMALEIRTRVQGANHWHTINARNNLDLFTTIAALPKEAQEALTEARKLEKTELANLTMQGRYREALPVAERLVAIRQRHLPAASSLVATALNANGIVCYDLGQYAQAEAHFHRAVDMSRKVYGDRHPNVAAGLGNLAMSLSVQDKYAEAHPAYEAALAIQLHAYGEESEAAAVAYNNLAGNFERLGEYGEAETRYRRALEILQRLGGETAERRATSHTNLGGILNRQAKYEEAEREYDRALKIKIKLYGEAHPETAYVYNNLGVCLVDQGKYAEAEPLYRRALEIRSRTLGENHLVTLQTFNNLANVLHRRGMLAEAELLLRRALHLQSAAAAGGNRSTAVWLTNLARILEAQGRPAEAKESLEQALSILQRILDVKHPDIAATKVDLAVALGNDEKYAEAEPILRSAATSLRERLRDQHPQTLQANGNLASNLYHQGKYAEAESLHRAVLSAYQRLFGERHPKTASTYRNLLIDLWAQGKYEEAKKLTAAAAASFEAARRQVGFAGLERTTFAAENSPLPLLAALAARDRQPLDAWQFLEHSLARGLLDDLSARPWTDEERKRELKLLRDIELLDSQISALLGAATSTAAGRDKAAGLIQLRDQRQLELAELQKDLMRKHSVAVGETYSLQRIQAQIPPDGALLAWVDFAGQPKGHDPGGEHWLYVLRHTGAPNGVRLPGTGPSASWTREDDGLPARLRQACTRRPRGEIEDNVLAGKLFAQRLGPAAPLLAATAGTPAVRHLVIMPSPQLRGIPIEVLTEAGAPGRYTVSYAPSGTMFGWLQEKRSAAEKTERAAAAPNILAVGDPIFGSARPERELPPPPDHGVMVTTVAPGSTAATSGLRSGDVLLRYADVDLNAVSDLGSAIAKLAAAPKNDGRPVAVVVWRDGERRELWVAPGPLGVTLSGKSAAQAVRAQRELEQLMRRSSVADFRRLEGAEREIQAVTGVFRTATVLKGSEASEQNLRKLAGEGKLTQFRYLHFATHGVLDTRSPMYSALVLSQDRLPAAYESMRAGQPAYDGRLTAAQILHGWRLDADLVTLSACETGLGKYQAGEGYLGFSQALFVAGARSLVLSLWQVDDTSTALLMTRFFENLLARRPDLKKPMAKAEALAEAKAWLRGLKADEVQEVAGGLVRGLNTEAARGRRVAQPAKQAGAAVQQYPYAHPYYWAGFILLGDPK